MSIKKIFSLGLLSLLICQTTVKAEIEHIFMPWKWSDSQVGVAAIALTALSQSEQYNPTTRYSIDALRAYILGSQIPAILRENNNRWRRNQVERTLAATVLGAEVARSFYGLWYRRFRN